MKLGTKIVMIGAALAVLDVLAIAGLADSGYEVITVDQLHVADCPAINLKVTESHCTETISMPRINASPCAIYPHGSSRAPLAVRVWKTDYG